MAFASVLKSGQVQGMNVTALLTEVLLLQGELGDDYVLYLLEDQEENPVAVVLPRDAAEQPLSPTQEVCCSRHRHIPSALSLVTFDFMSNVGALY